MSKRSFFVRLVPCRCLRGEEEAVISLDYSHCSLETVPKEVFSFEKTLQELFLDANQIEELPKQLFNCQFLHRLSLPDNDLSVLPPAIANLVNLRELDVSKNSIQEFPENIKNCKVLAIMEASVNPISKLPEGFTQLLSLTQLYLNDAFLEFLPANFGRLTKLQILELRENQLKMLPKSMQKLTLLERLDLGSNEFTEVPDVLEHLTGLKELWMDVNRLTFLPGTLGKLKQLLYLDVSKNNLEVVDDQISGCENLQDLLLSNNALRQLPGSIGSLRKLTGLKVDENQLVCLPDSIGGLTSLDELDCSFNEIEALPSTIGKCVHMRVFAADHNFLTHLPPELGNWKNTTVLFLHTNKLESLPEELGDMQKLKVINLSNNKLKNLPYSFTKLSQMTAMWLSENQSKALIPLQKEEEPETQKTVLTNYMFPQQTSTEDYVPNSDSESFNPVLWEEQRKQRAQVAFECDEDKDEREAPPIEGNLKRYPTPYPDELKNMVKTAQSLAHRLKEDDNDGSGKAAKSAEKNNIGLQDVGVKVLEATCTNGVLTESNISLYTHSQNLAMSEASEFFSSQTTTLKSSKASMLNHEDTLEDSEELSDEEEEMKIAEMRPPLIEISSNQPKVLTLSKDKRDSQLDDTVANSNQNNSNCSSPSRMSDSVSLTTDSSQDNSLCTPEPESKMPFIPGSRHEDENMNPPKETHRLLHNGDLSVKVRKSFMEKGLSDVVGDSYCRWDHINMNLSKPDNMLQLHDTSGPVDYMQNFSNIHHFQNGNSMTRTDSSEVTHRSNMSLSRSTEELSPERPCPTPLVVKAQSVSSIETGGMKVYSFDTEREPYGPVAGSPPGGAVPDPPSQCIVRSKSASLLNDQVLQVYSDQPSKPLVSTRHPISSSMALGNIQYTDSNIPKEGLWGQRLPKLQGNHQPPPHSLANTNFSNRNQAPPYPGLLKQHVLANEGQPRSNTLQRQCSTTSIGDPRWMQLPDGEYLTFKDVHTQARGPLAMSHAVHRPLSARKYSIDIPTVGQTMGHYPHLQELQERTMSVSDFQQGSPSKRDNALVQSDHLLQDGPRPGSAGLGGGRVPSDWRDRVMWHIEGKKLEKVPMINSEVASSAWAAQSQNSIARHPSREQLLDYLMLKVSQQRRQTQATTEILQNKMHVKVDKDPELGFSISGGIGGRGNPFRPEDNGIFVTRVQPEGPACNILQPGDKIIQANGYSFVNIDHGSAVSLLKTFPNSVDLTIIREVQA